MKLATPEEKAQWPAANYVDPVWRGPIVVGLTASTMAVAMVFMVLRFWGKGVLRAALGLDDWMMLIATVCNRALISIRILFANARVDIISARECNSNGFLAIRTRPSHMGSKTGMGNTVRQGEI